MTPQEIEIKEKKDTWGDRTEMVLFAGKVPVNILLFRRHTHDFVNGWETDYLNELIDTLKPGMEVFDIGAEEGEFSAMAANIVGGENVHLFEPSPDYWPNIKKLWSINDLKEPGGCFKGYAGGKSDFDIIYDIVNHAFGWPKCSNGELFYGTHQCVPYYDPNITISIDDYCEIKNVYPDLIMMDIEGAELDCIRGTIKTIQKNHPIIFMSIHSDQLIQQRSAGTKDEIFYIIEKFGYTAKHINTDHEEHWKFEKK